MPPTTARQLTMEKTPSYFVTGAVPKRVHELNPHMKLIVVVRDPVTRAISDYTQTASKRSGMSDFSTMAFNSSDSSVNARWGAVRIGIYARHLRKWLPYFPRSQFLFVDGRKLIDSPADEVNRAERFLGLVPNVSPKQFVFDTGKGFPCVLKRPDSEPHCLGKTKGRAHPIISEDVLQRLRTFYRPHNEQFFRLIGRRFDW